MFKKMFQYVIVVYSKLMVSINIHLTVVYPYFSHADFAHKIRFI